MGDLLLNPNGRLLRNRFWQGLIILTVATVLVSLGAWLINEMIALLSYVLIFPYICVYGKRLHDSGRSAWWVIGVWGAGLIIQVVLLMIFIFFILPGFMSVEQKETLEEIFKLAEAGDSAQVMQGMEYLMAELEGVLQRTSIVLTIIVNALLGFIIGSLRTIPEDNQYGPVPELLD